MTLPIWLLFVWYLVTAVLYLYTQVTIAGLPGGGSKFKILVSAFLYFFLWPIALIISCCVDVYFLITNKDYDN